MMSNQTYPYGLPPTAIQSINQLFKANPKVKRVILYGSRAKGNFRPGSDIDLCIEGNLDLRELLALETKIDDLLLPWKIDLSLKHKIDNPELLDHIKRVGVSIYENK